MRKSAMETFSRKQHDALVRTLVLQFIWHTYLHTERKHQRDTSSGESSLISLSDDEDQDDLAGMVYCQPMYHVCFIFYCDTHSR